MSDPVMIVMVVLTFFVSIVSYMSGFAHGVERERDRMSRLKRALTELRSPRVLP